MDFDYWSSRVCPSKYLSAVHAGLLRPDNHPSAMDDSDGDDDGRAYFPCPFCYVDIELPLLCTHLRDEHCFDFKNAVCPLCASDPGKDVTGHFITHHPNSLKRRKRQEKSAASALLAKKLQSNRRGSKSLSSPDPLLSPFICSIPKEIPKEDNSQSSATDKFERITASKENSEENAEKVRRADFVQQLLISTISWSLPESQHFE